MFFYAAKLIWFVLQPSAALVILLVLGALCLCFGATRLGTVLVVTVTVLFVIAGFGPLGPALILPLEDRFPRVEPKDPVTGIIVLGGAIDQSIGEPRGVVSLTDAGERMTEGAALARRFPNAKLVFTGGTANVIPNGYTEGQQARRFFKQEGIPEDRLTIEDKSRDTAENALFTKALVQPKPGETWLLVTSGWHMPRSVGCFRAVGWPVVPWPVDYRTAGPSDLWQLMARPSFGLNLVDVAAKEWIGLVAYRLIGRIDTLFPGP